MRILIIGLDGATWDVLDEFLLSHCMPNLKKLKVNGYSGVLQSTEPPITPAAWTTCITGCNPQTHGVTGFREYSFKDDSLGIGNATGNLAPNMWQELSKQDFNVVSINVPWTYPCQEVRGIMVAGYGSPGIFTYPEPFKDKLLKRIEDYDILAHWDRSKDDTLDQFKRKIALIERSFEHRLEAARLASEEVNWDVMMVQFHDLDKLGHYMWPYINNETRDSYIPQRDRIFQMFEKLDQIIGSLLDLADTGSLLVVVVSDHGMGGKVINVKPNWLLYRWGHLKFQSPLRRLIRRSRRNIYSMFSKKSGFLNKPRMSVELKMPIDWGRSKAIVMLTQMSGYVYLNVRGRQPCGCVNPGKEYETIIKDLTKRFSEVSCPVTKQPIFTRVASPAEIYNVEGVDPERFGDLILVPQPGYFLKSTTSRKGSYAEPLPADSLEGCHRPEGIFIFSGPNIKAAGNKETHIADIAPTVYAALGAKLPSYMDGKVLEDIFLQEIKIQYKEDSFGSDIKLAKRQRLSANEEALIAKHLTELGYLD